MALVFTRPLNDTYILTEHLFLYSCKDYYWVDWFGFVGLVGFYGISTIVGYLMPNPLYTYILNIYDLVWLGFMAYQPL